jgi:hypothetical protein
MPGLGFNKIFGNGKAKAGAGLFGGGIGYFKVALK